MKDFGGPKQPLRASNLPTLFNCTKSFVLKTLLDGQDGGGGELAQTGSLTHLLIETHHKLGEKQVSAALREGQKKYPLATAADAFRYYEKYKEREQKDPRGKIIANEQEVKIEIPAAGFDKTKTPIVITGHIDQIRDFGDVLWVVDFKTGYKLGEDMVRDHTPQLAVYMWAAHLQYKKPVTGVIGRVRSLMRSNLQFWWELPFSESKCLAVLQEVQLKVAAIRAGVQPTAPGKWCDYCHLEPHPTCIDDVRRKPSEAGSDGKRVALPVAGRQLKSADDLWK